ncbi:MAG: class I SAM-dependent methyltransferase [Actinomycetota bacterium]|nr:class I SAM-dependent methyltransferase [Actinomycetota bacterium]
MVSSSVLILQIKPLFRLVDAGVSWARTYVGKNVKVDQMYRRMVKVIDFADSSSGLYGPSYFGFGRTEGDREGLSGYDSLSIDTSKSDLSAAIVDYLFAPASVIEVGCAEGHLVSALVRLGIDARGYDYSRFAVRHSLEEVSDRIKWGDLLKGLSAESKSADVVVALETLEHLPPEMIHLAIEELIRLSRGFIYVTMPSFGPNDMGFDGWFEGKVKDERLEYYKSLGASYEGPVPTVDLAVDKNGNLVEGHTAIASFSWWRRQFQNAGCVREIELEKHLYEKIAEFSMTPHWNAYLFRVPNAKVEVKRDLADEEAFTRSRRLFDLDRYL